MSPRALLYLVFAVSGLTALVYEATWTRYLQLFLGHAAYAQVLVLSLFMGGMAAGALLASGLARTRLRPLVAYAVIEGILGLAALLFHPIFDGITAYAYASLLPGTQGSLLAQVLQWGLASLLILPQSILLGMTFPLMSSAVLRLESGAGGKVFAMLYFANSAGAVLGVLLAGFWLIETWGLQATMVVAGIGNLAVATAAFMVAREHPAAAAPVIRPARSEGVGRWLLAFAFLTAAASFLYEIAWLRMLALVQGASTHAFETMLSAFILGIALGGLWIRRRIDQFASPLAALARIQILMGLAALATLPAYHYAFDVMQFAMPRLPRDLSGYFDYMVVSYLISAAIMVPASFFAGMTLPLLTTVLYRQGRGESEIGKVYGWNTFGSIAGIALGGLVLMPQIGLKNMLLAGAAIDIGLGLALLAWLWRRGELLSPRRAAALAGVCGAMVATLSFGFELDVERMASGIFRSGQARLAGNGNVIHHADGRTATVTLVRYESGTLAISTNGKIDAAINMKRPDAASPALPTADEYTMTLIAALPLAHAPQARRIAVIGHGSGLTTHALLASPLVEQVDVIEIEPEMFRAARAFLPRVGRAYEDPRVRYHIEDARAFFARAAGRYDLIVSEPSNPWVSGVASLYTPEFYRQVRQALATDGLFVQWFQLYEIDRPLVRSIVQGIGSVYADYLLYASHDSDLMLIASPNATLPPMQDTMFSWPQMRDELALLGIGSPAQMQLFQVGSRPALAPLLEYGRMNTDYFPYLEFGAARARFLRRNDLALTRLARDPVPALEILSGFDPPGLPELAEDLIRGNPHFRDVAKAREIAAALDRHMPRPGARSAMNGGDRRHLARLRTPPADRDRDAWEDWFSSLLALSGPLLAHGAPEPLDAFLRRPDVARALDNAPAGFTDRFALLSHVAHRDLAGMLAGGKRLLGEALQSRNPAFHDYVAEAMLTACLALRSSDPACAAALAAVEDIEGHDPVRELLLAHVHRDEARSAARPAAGHLKP